MGECSSACFLFEEESVKTLFLSHPCASELSKSELGSLYAEV